MVDQQAVMLVILDGWGEGAKTDTNAVLQAKTPNIDRLAAKYPKTTLAAHNGAVGLPEGQMGNSEVGHLNIGAGRIVYQDFSRINKAIKTGVLEKKEVLLALSKKSVYSTGVVQCSQALFR